MSAVTIAAAALALTAMAVSACALVVAVRLRREIRRPHGPQILAALNSTVRQDKQLSRMLADLGVPDAGHRSATPQENS